MRELETLIWAIGGHLQNLTRVEETWGFAYSSVDFAFLLNIGPNLQGGFVN